MNSAAFVIPTFFLFLGLEYLAARKRGRGQLFVYENSIANLSIGLAERLLSLFITSSFYTFYFYIYDHYRLLTIPDHWIGWILILLVTDLIWYWYHRLGHEINFLWGAHIVHHHSEDFNYTISARVTTFQAVVRNMFWCLLPLIGFNPSMVILILIVHGTYSFFTHTQMIGKLGWLEKILITPSHHGVHHASNPKYLNKNYGDIFVFWDKLFGTFQAEEEKPVYGLTHPLKSHSFLWQHFHYYAELWVACKRSGSFVGAVRVLFGRPEGIDQTIRPALERMLLPSRNMPSQRTLCFRAYLNGQLVGSALVIFFFTLFYDRLNLSEVILIVLLMLLTLIICGAMLEQKQWIYYLEVARCGVLAAYSGLEAESLTLFLIGLFVVILLSPIQAVERSYIQFLYGHSSGQNVK